jgi:MFS transporter, PPP family, 3-phenylpropionic acid transporter
LIGYCAGYAPLLLFAQLLHACSFGIAHSVSIELVRHYFKNGQQGQGQALYSSLSFGAGGAVGALMGGLLWDYSALSAFVVAAVAAVLGLMISYRWLHPDLTQKAV